MLSELLGPLQVFAGMLLLCAAALLLENVAATTANCREWRRRASGARGQKSTIKIRIADVTVQCDKVKAAA